MKSVKKIKHLQKKKNKSPSFPVILKIFNQTSYNLLLKKYTAKNYTYSYILIDHLILYHKSTILSKYKDLQIFNDKTEYLIRYYEKRESLCRLKHFTAYYGKYSSIFPNYSSLIERKLLYENINQKQKVIKNEYSTKLKSKVIKKRNNGIFFDDSLKNELGENNSILFNNNSIMLISNNIKEEVNNYIPNNDSSSKSVNYINDIINAMNNNKIDNKELNLIITDEKSKAIKKSHEVKKIIIKKKINKINKQNENYPLKNNSKFSTKYSSNNTNFISKINNMPKKISNAIQKQYKKLKTNSFLTFSKPNLKKNNLLNNQYQKNKNNIINKVTIASKKTSSINSIHRMISSLPTLNKKIISANNSNYYYKQSKIKSKKNLPDKLITKAIFQNKIEHFKEKKYSNVLNEINISNFDTDDGDYQGILSFCNSKKFLMSKDNIFQNKTLNLKKNNNCINTKRRSMFHIKKNNNLDKNNTIIKSEKKIRYRLSQDFFLKTRMRSFGNTLMDYNSKNILWKTQYNENLEKINTNKNKTSNNFMKNKLNEKHFKYQATLKSPMNSDKYQSNFDIKNNKKFPYNRSVILKKRNCTDNEKKETYNN